MKFRALFGWGIAIYAVLLLVSSLLAAHGIGGTLLSRGLLLATLIVTAGVATRSLHLYNERDTAVYAIGWVVCAVVLDALLVVPSTGWALFADWNVWVGYFVLLSVPIAVTFISKRPLE